MATEAEIEAAVKAKYRADMDSPYLSDRQYVERILLAAERVRAEAEKQLDDFRRLDDGSYKEIVRLRAALAETERERDRVRKHAEEMNDGWRTANFANHDLKADLAAAREVIATLLVTLPPFFYSEEMNIAADDARAFLERTVK